MNSVKLTTTIEGKEVEIVEEAFMFSFATNPVSKEVSITFEHPDKVVMYPIQNMDSLEGFCNALIEQADLMRASITDDAGLSQDDLMAKYTKCNHIVEGNTSVH